MHGHPDTPDTHTTHGARPRVPGVRYRTRRIPSTRTVVRSGRPKQVPAHITVHEPRPPRDWDRAIRHGLLVLAVVFLGGLMVWSTISIGSLLTAIAPAPAAYAIAAVYDGVWIGALALEWLSRYDTHRAHAPRVVGILALLAAMGAITAHGHLAGSVWIGIIGAAASALVKTLWVLVLRHYSYPLDADTAAWIAAVRSETGASLAVADASGEQIRHEAHLRAMRHAYGLPDLAPRPEPAPIASIAPVLPPAAEAAHPEPEPALPPVPPAPPKTEPAPSPTAQQTTRPPLPEAPPEAPAAETLAKVHHLGIVPGSLAPHVEQALGELGYEVPLPELVARVQQLHPGAKPESVQRVARRKGWRKKGAAG